eukprot:160017_1
MEGIIDTLDDVQQMGDNEPEFKTILRQWKLLQYANILEEEGWEDIESWTELDENILMEMGFKTGHRKKFMKFIRQKYGNQQIEQKYDQHNEKQQHNQHSKLPLKNAMEQRLLEICNENKMDIALISIKVDNINDLKNKGQYIVDTVMESVVNIIIKQTQNKYIEAFKAEMLQTQDSNGLAEEHVVITDEERHNMEFGELLLLFSDLVRWEFALNDREYPIIKRKKKWQCPMIYGVLLGMLNDKLKLNVEKFKQKDEDNNNE